MNKNQLRGLSILLMVLLFLSLLKSGIISESNYSFINDSKSDASNTELDAIMLDTIKNAKITGNLNRETDRFDYFKIYLNRGDRITFTFSINSDMMVFLAFYDKVISENRVNLYLESGFIIKDSISIKESKNYIIRIYFPESSSENETDYVVYINVGKFIDVIINIYIVGCLIALFLVIEPFNKLNKLFLSINFLISLSLILTMSYMTLNINFAILVAITSFFATQVTLLWRYGFFEEMSQVPNLQEFLNQKNIISLLRTISIPVIITILSLIILGTSFSWI